MCRKAVLEGAVSEWNKENPTKAVQPGDRVAASATRNWLEISRSDVAFKGIKKASFVSFSTPKVRRTRPFCSRI